MPKTKLYWLKKRAPNRNFTLIHGFVRLNSTPPPSILSFIPSSAQFNILYGLLGGKLMSDVKCWEVLCPCMKERNSNFLDVIWRCGGLGERILLPSVRKYEALMVMNFHRDRPSSVHWFGPWPTEHFMRTFLCDYISNLLSWHADSEWLKSLLHMTHKSSCRVNTRSTLYRPHSGREPLRLIGWWSHIEL